MKKLAALALVLIGCTAYAQEAVTDGDLRGVWFASDSRENSLHFFVFGPNSSLHAVLAIER